MEDVIKTDVKIRSFSKIRVGVLVSAILFLQACAMTPKDQLSYAPSRPQPEMLAPATQGAIFQAGQEISLFEDEGASCGGYYYGCSGRANHRK